MRADATGEVCTRRAHVVPAPFDGLQQPRIAGLDGDIDGSAVEIDLPHGVPGHGRRVAHRLAVLPVAGAVTSLPQQPLAALLQQVAGEREVALIAGHAVELDEGHLDLGVTVDPVPSDRVRARDR